MTAVLVVVMSLGWGWGSHVYRHEFPTMEACLEALSAVQTNKDGNAVVAYCAPKESNQ